jgi:ubiquinone/menaquinone biosynthesis C-methylase UbiE
MPQPQADEAARHTSSTGQVLTDAGWLDGHFEACRPEYTAMLASVGIGAGWHVLDAGCGSGSYLPLLAGHVGPTGCLAAIDLAATNIAAVQARRTAWRLPCPLEAQVGALTSLPFADASFDAAWCANVSQYLGDADLRRALAELRRVVRPGGLVAVKDVDMQLMRVAPADPFLVSHLADASFRNAAAGPEARGSVRGRELRRWLEAAGLADVWQRTTLIERWAPLAPVERRFMAEWLAFLASIAEERGVPAADLPAWKRLRDPDAPDHPVDDPAFYACEGQTVAVGVVRTPT